MIIKALTYYKLLTVNHHPAWYHSSMSTTAAWSIGTTGARQGSKVIGLTAGTQPPATCGRGPAMADSVGKDVASNGFNILVTNELETIGLLGKM